MKEYTVRKLTRKDRCILTSLVLRFVEETGRDKLISMHPQGASGKGKDTSETEMLSFAVNLLTEMVKYIEEDISAWFADLLSVSVDDFNNLPFDIDVIIIDQLLSMKEFIDFFLKVSLVLKKIKGLANRFSK